MRFSIWVYLIFVGFMIALSFASCGVLFFREVECRELNYAYHLKWLAGETQDTITFVKPDNTKRKFVIDSKKVYHTPQYFSDTGCNCLDHWRVKMISGSDTISMINFEYYIEDQKSEFLDYVFVNVGGMVTRFKTNHRSLLDSVIINDVIIHHVLKFDNPQNEVGKFIEVYIAENIGIVQIVNADGSKWINENLTTTLNTDISTFQYEEIFCDE